MKTDGNHLMLRALYAVCAMLLAVSLAGCGKNYTREQFSQMAMGKTETEVTQSLGKPSWVNDGKPKTWIYYHKTLDSANQNKEDYKAVLIFGPDSSGQDKVVKVEFAQTA